MRLLTSSCLSLLCLSAFPSAMAGEFEDYARVISVKPQIERVNQPRQECRTDYVTVQRPQRNDSVGGAVLGGIAGGLLGNQVGGGNGRTVATAVGAITGAIVGDRIDNGDNVVSSSQQPVQQCRTVDNWTERNAGYYVTYEYRGHTQSSVMPYDPGERVKLRVSITPR